MAFVATQAKCQTDFVTGTLNTVAGSCTLGTDSAHISATTVGFGGAVFTVASGTWTGAISFYGSGDGGATWALLAVTPSVGGATTTTASSNGAWQANVSAYTHICMLQTANSGGSVVAKIHLSPVSARVPVVGGGSPSFPPQPANYVLAGPTPSFRPLTAADLPATPATASAWYSQAFGGTAVVASASGWGVNLTKVNPIYVNVTIPNSTYICYGIGAGDNSTALTDIGIYTNPTGGGTGTLVAHTGALVGNANGNFSGTGMRCRAWSTGGPITIPQGWYALGITTNNATPAFAPTGTSGVGVNTPWVSYTDAGATTGGALNPTITVPASVWNGASLATSGAVIPNLIIRDSTP